MFTTKNKKTLLEISEDDTSLQESILHKRKTFKNIQNPVGQKENVTPFRFTLKTNSDTEAKKKNMVSTAVQTEESAKVTISADDLLGDEPSSDYWRLLAETRGEALDNSFRENEILKEQMENLKIQNASCQEMLNDSRSLISVLEEILHTQDEENKAEEAES